MNITFGDGADSDTLHAMFDGIVGMNVAVTIKEGTMERGTFDATLEGVAPRGDLALDFGIRDSDDELIDKRIVYVDRITKLHVY